MNSTTRFERAEEIAIAFKIEGCNWLVEVLVALARLVQRPGQGIGI